MNPALQRLRRRLDAIALEQLRTIAAQQAEEIDELRDRLYRAEHDADSWRDDALAMQAEICTQRGAAPGIDIAGRLHIVQPEVPA